MDNSNFSILQVGTFDVAGGAERVAMNLHAAYRARGHHAWIAVGTKRGNDPDVFPIDNDWRRNHWARFWIQVGNGMSGLVGKLRGIGRLQALAWNISQPLRLRARRKGQEDFDFPATRHLLDLTPHRPHVVHCHNLHGDYFDLRELGPLSHKVPVVLTLHDAWLLSGHCAHSLGCQRWKTGCGQCPDLTIYPPIPRDLTARNWQRKQEIYRQSRLYIATPSHWLMQQVQQSMLAQAIAQARVIPNGVDRQVFTPNDQQAARAELGIPPHAKVLLFAAAGIRNNWAKDYQTMRRALQIVGARLPHAVDFVALGQTGHDEQLGAATIRFVPFQQDPAKVARYYQAADLYLHAAKADTFPNSILEAMACGKPVVATAVGGIPEQIIEGKTGFLVPPGDAQGMAQRICILLSDRQQASQMGRRAAAEAERFDLAKQVQAYLDWYAEIITASFAT